MPKLRAIVEIQVDDDGPSEKEVKKLIAETLEVWTDLKCEVREVFVFDTED